MCFYLWLWRYQGVGKGEGYAGGFRSQEVIARLLPQRGHHSLGHLLVNDITCGCGHKGRKVKGFACL